ncbi:hypothetical protein E2C01_000957 [Portunus trituberculatus]|uniref:Uncharacterized protein n=1 Tax=Portunus trituberculatus TaxID=210409 RepID=A0A5B7CI14_PORTR|nr:hypothetical protein [Portunus trituberculatus]
MIPHQKSIKPKDLLSVLLQMLNNYSKSFSSPPLFSSFCSMEEMMRHDARRAPITFLYATESRFLSSTVSSTSMEATSFMASTISVHGRIGGFSMERIIEDRRELTD